MAVFDIFYLRTLCHVQERQSHSRQCYQREGVFQIMAFSFKRSFTPLSCQRVAGGRLMLMILVLLTSPESLFCTMHKVKKWSRCRDPVRASIFWILEFSHRFHLPLAFGIRRIMAYRRHIFIHLFVAQAFSKSTHKFLLGWDHISCLGLSFCKRSLTNSKVWMYMPSPRSRCTAAMAPMSPVQPQKLEDIYLNLSSLATILIVNMQVMRL